MKSKKVFEGTGVPCAIFAAALVILLPLRTVQYFNNIESGSGFYAEHNFTVYLLAVAAALACLGIVISGFVKRKSFVTDFEPVRRPGCGILSALLTVTAAVDAITCFNYTANLGIDFIRMPLYPDSLPVTEKLVALQGFCAIASAVYFALCSAEFISGKSTGEKYRLLSLMPVIWSIVRLVYRFSITISYLRVSQLAIEMFMLVFMILFFMTYAQVNSRVNAKGLDWKLIAYGLPASLFAIIGFVPQFITILAGRSDLLYSYSVPCVCDIVAAVFILSTVIYRISIKVEASENTEESTEEDVQEDSEAPQEEENQ